MNHITRTLCFLFCALAPVATWASCNEPATAIHHVQGTGEQSPMVGETVTVQGILTHDARVPGGFSGFYLQQPDTETDNNPATSEALFIYTRKLEGTPGQKLRVTGTVKEYHGLTELVDIRQLTACGPAPMPEAIPLSLPWPQTPESLENMLVRFDAPLTVVEHYNLAVYGEVTLAASEQIMPTEYRPPGPEAFALSQYHRQHRLTLDDGRSVRNPRPIPWPPKGLTYQHTLRAGDTVSGLHGVLDYRFDRWRLQPSGTPEFRSANPRPEPPPEPGAGTVRVMALNLRNYFNGDGQGGGFPTSRGAETPEQLRVQQGRLVSVVRQSNPHILAVSELENDGYGTHSAIAELARALGSHWRFIATPGEEGSDQIRTALLYREDRITPVGKSRRLQTGPYTNQGRPPVAQRFRLTEQARTLRVVATHLKSKSCRNARGANTDQGDGQGCYNQRRSREAEAIVAWLSSLPQSPDLAGTLIAGDLNSYAREAPVQHFGAAGYQSLAHRFQPCTPEACPHHSYRFRGHKGSLDYLLGSQTLLDRATTAGSWNINADEPRALGYTEVPGATGPWRSSDHNPVITDIRLGR